MYKASFSFEAYPIRIWCMMYSRRTLILTTSVIWQKKSSWILVYKHVCSSRNFLFTYCPEVVRINVLRLYRTIIRDRIARKKICLIAISISSNLYLLYLQFCSIGDYQLRPKLKFTKVAVWRKWKGIFGKSEGNQGKNEPFLRICYSEVGFQVEVEINPYT